MTQPEPIAPVDDLRIIAYDLAEEVMSLGYDFHECTNLSAEKQATELILAALQRVQQGR